MKSLLKAFLVGSILVSGTGAQNPQTPALRPGVSVQMAVAANAVEMRAADDPDSTVVAITADGKVYVGVKPAEPAALSNLSGETVYVKIDARAPYQTVLAALDALRGKSVVLLTASPGNAASQGFVWPYGLKLVLSR
jgi:hypothetical protein